MDSNEINETIQAVKQKIVEDEMKYSLQGCACIGKPVNLEMRGDLIYPNLKTCRGKDLVEESLSREAQTQKAV